MKKATLITEDNVKLIANHFSVPAPSPGMSLFHMMPATKESWNDFAKELVEAGIGALAIDFRGHGESQGGPEGYMDYEDNQQQSKEHDVHAAITFQYNEHHAPLFVAGGSIGANLALQILSKDDRIKKAILLSPGINYRGVKSIPLAENVSEDQEVYVIAAKDDTRAGGPANQQAQQIYAALKCKKKIQIFDTGGHATEILEAHPDFMEDLIDWLKLEQY